MTEIDLKAKFDQLEIQRQADVEALDQTIKAIDVLYKLDRHLVAAGLQPALQLDHPTHPALVSVEEEPDAEGPPATTDAPVVPIRPAKSSRRYTAEEKAEAVRLADELGSDNAAGKQLGCSGVSISNWRKDGHGRKFKSVTETAVPRRQAPEPAADGPSMRCPVCRKPAPIDGEINEVTKVTAMREHYKTSPDCQEALRKRRA